MKHRIKNRITALALAAAMLLPAAAPAANAQENSDRFGEQLEKRFANPSMEERPAARWWLAEGLHTDETLRESIQELYDYGFGSLEFLTLDESEYLDDATYAWGSEEWIHDSQLIVEECTKRGMGVSFTSGTHWSTANLMSINPDQEAASQELGYKTLNLTAGQVYDGELPQAALTEHATAIRLVKVIAAQADASAASGVTQLKEASLKDVTDLAYQDGDIWKIRYTATEDQTLFVFWQYGTSETYKPAITNSYTINYYSKDGAEALISYWSKEVLTPELQKMIQQNGNVMLYMDSLELNPKGADTTGNLWSADYLEEFEARRGYDISKYLPILIMSNYSFMLPKNYPYTLDSGDELCQKIRSDLYQTNTELYMENCLDVLREWLHSFGMKLRAENSYGKELELSQPVKSLDFVETESYEFAGELDALRGQAGAAHLYDKVYSSETGANTSDNYIRDNRYYRQLFYTQFAAGVQKTVTHGYSSAYGPEQHCVWPGFEGMTSSISERFNRRQPNSLDYPVLWGDHIARLQSVLHQGTAQMDVGILRTDYQYYMLRFLETKDYDTNALRQHRGFYWQDTTLQDHGYTYDYFSPYLLQDADISCENGIVQPDGAGYQALLVYQEEMPYESAEVLYQWAKDGLPVVIVDGPTTENVQMFRYKQNSAGAITTGKNDGKDDQLAALMEQIKALDTVRTVQTQAQAYDALQELGVKPRAEFVEKNQKLLTVTRKAEDATYLYIYHYMYTDTENYVGEISVNGIYKPYLYDTWNNRATAIGQYTYEDGRTILPVNLAPGEVLVMALDPNADESTTIVRSSHVENVTEENGVQTLYVTESGTAAITYSDGTAYVQDVYVPDDIILDHWDLTVESWEPGEKLIRTEDRGTGHISKEVSYSTKKVEIPVGNTTLLSWSNLEKVGDTVSGVGYYRNEFNLSDHWSECNGLVFRADSFCGGTASLTVNGQHVTINMDSRCADISQYVQPGKNSLEVRVTTSLRNRILDYNPGLWAYGAPSGPADYGMVGSVTLDAYTKVQSGITVNLTGESDVTVDVDELSYDVTVSGAEKLATATLTFHVSGLVEPTVVPADGWYVMGQTVDNGVLTAVIGNNAGLTGEGVIATLTAKTTGIVGSVKVELAEAQLSAYVGDGETFVNVIPGTMSVETKIDYSIYDVNRDGVVNQLDLTRAQRHYGTDDEICDVDNNGTVDIADLILILNNYTK